MRNQIWVLTVFGLARCLGAWAAAPEGAVFQPTFHTEPGTIEAGKAFVVRLEGCAHPLLITALRLLGPVGGLPSQLAADQLSDRVYDITLETIGRSKQSRALNALNITPADALPCCADPNTHGVGDLAAFELPDTLAALALPLATQAPAIGESLFVLSPHGKVGALRMRHEVQLQAAVNGYLLFAFSEPGIELVMSTGAPIINRDGQVVAVNIGRESSPQGLRRGVGNPVTRWGAATAHGCTAT
jgi:hypothetical protein